MYQPHGKHETCIVNVSRLFIVIRHPGGVGNLPVASDEKVDQMARAVNTVVMMTKIMLEPVSPGYT